MTLDFNQNKLNSLIFILNKKQINKIIKITVILIAKVMMRMMICEILDMFLYKYIIFFVFFFFYSYVEKYKFILLIHILFKDLFYRNPLCFIYSGSVFQNPKFLINIYKYIYIYIYIYIFIYFLIFYIIIFLILSFII